MSRLQSALASTMVGLFLANVTHAADIQPSNDWHLCHQDADCMLADSVCGPIAVATPYAKVAQQYHEQHDQKSDCKSANLYAKPNAVACEYESCTAVYN